MSNSAKYFTNCMTKETKLFNFSLQTFTTYSHAPEHSFKLKVPHYFCLPIRQIIIDHFRELFPGAARGLVWRKNFKKSGKFKSSKTYCVTSRNGESHYNQFCVCNFISELPQCLTLWKFRNFSDFTWNQFWGFQKFTI